MSQEKKYNQQFLKGCFDNLSKTIDNIDNPKVPFAQDDNQNIMITLKELFKGSDDTLVAERCKFFLSLTPENLQKALVKYPYPRAWREAFITITSVIDKQRNSFDDFKNMMLLAEAIHRYSPNKLIENTQLSQMLSVKISEFANTMQGEAITILQAISNTAENVLFNKKSLRDDKRNFDLYMECIRRGKDINSLLENKVLRQRVVLSRQQLIDLRSYIGGSLVDRPSSVSFKEKVDKFRKIKIFDKKGKELGHGSYNTVYGLPTGSKDNRVVRAHKNNEERFSSKNLPDSLYIVKNVIENAQDDTNEPRYDVLKRFKGDLSKFKGGKHLNKKEYLQIAYCAGRGLLDLQEAGICHGDIKPENILQREIGPGRRLAALSDTEGCQYFDRQAGNRPHKPITATFLFSLDAEKVRSNDFDSIKHDNYALLISLLLIYLQDGEYNALDEKLTAYAIACKFRPMAEQVTAKRERDEAVNNAINNIKDESVKNLLIALRDHGLDKVLSQECFKEAKEMFSEMEKKREEKAKKYAPLQNASEDYLSIHSRGFQLLIIKAEEIIKALDKTPIQSMKPNQIQEIKEWQKEAGRILAKSKGNPNKATKLIRQAEERIPAADILDYEVRSQLIDSLKSGIDKKMIPTTLVHGRKHVNVGELLSKAPMEKVKSFFKDLIENCSSDQLRRVFQEKEYRACLPILKEALGELTQGNNDENNSVKTANILVTVRAFQKYAPQELDSGTNGLVKQWVESQFNSYLTTESINPAKTQSIRNKVTKFFNGENSSFAYNLAQKGLIGWVKGSGSNTFSFSSIFKKPKSKPAGTFKGDVGGQETVTKLKA
jgi:serine/threonine protein kinase